MKVVQPGTELSLAGESFSVKTHRVFSRQEQQRTAGQVDAAAQMTEVVRGTGTSAHKQRFAAVKGIGRYFKGDKLPLAFPPAAVISGVGFPAEQSLFEAGVCENIALATVGQFDVFNAFEVDSGSGVGKIGLLFGRLAQVDIERAGVSLYLSTGQG